MGNTRIYYLYRDADNYKVPNECVVQGVLSNEQKAVIMDSLDEGEYFIPAMVGLPERRFDTYDLQADHPFFELSADAFTITDELANVELHVDDLVKAFAASKGNWQKVASAVMQNAVYALCGLQGALQGLRGLLPITTSCLPRGGKEGV